MHITELLISETKQLRIVLRGIKARAYGTG